MDILSEDNRLLWVLSPQACYVAFVTVLLAVIAAAPAMFIRRHGRKHSFTGATYLLWINLGLMDAFGVLSLSAQQRLFFDAVLGILGLVLTLTAAAEFQHKHVKNVASGTLDAHATVTHSEMLEHAFYQGLNLAQILYLHALEHMSSRSSRLAAALLVTAPWEMRSRFPVHKFSDNYNKVDDKSSLLVRLMYRLKKYQYVFYKHFLLHGLNVSLALMQINVALRPDFRLYWMLLNMSYVMEFFLQTLVKKGYLAQGVMLLLQSLLMSASTLAAIAVLRNVSTGLCLLSTALNFINRKRDLLNTGIIIAAGIVLETYSWR